jgi:intergrase/recombinase
MHKVPLVPGITSLVENSQRRMVMSDYFLGVDIYIPPSTEIQNTVSDLRTSISLSITELVCEILFAANNNEAKENFHAQSS